MENSVRKYIIKLINKFSGIYRYFKRYGLKLRWNTLFHKNYSYGYLIETLQIKFILMLNDWPEYRNSDKQKEKLIELINDTEKLLLLLEKEEKISHLRSNEYNKLQKAFFEKLNLYSADLFY